MGSPIAEALLSRRGVPKAELKEMVGQCEAAAAQTGHEPAAEGAWTPVELSPLNGRPFALAMHRLSPASGGSGLASWGKIKGLGLAKVAGAAKAAAAPTPKTRGRQMSDVI